MPYRPPVFRPAGMPSERERKRQYEADRNRRDLWRHWYRSQRWRDMRAAVLKAMPVCMRCRQAPSTTVNHVKPHRGNAELFWNGQLEGVCSHCHSSVIQSEEARER